MAETLNELEQKGATLFERMGLPCSSHLKDAPLMRLNPDGAYRKGEHLEVDYLLPQNDVCLVGEITDRAASKCPEKLKTFQRHINAIDHALKAATTHADRVELWRVLGVHEDQISNFRNVRSILGFAILTKIEECEIPAQEVVQNCVVLYRYHWDLLSEYADTIGGWAKHPFLDMFGLSAPHSTVSRPLRFEAKEGNLLAACDKFVTADRKHTSHVVTFLANPYDLLPYAVVCRRDNLPSLEAQQNRRYQRTVFNSKLTDIRSRLLDSHRFIFPNSILAVLAENCTFDSSKNILEIPDRYKSMNIIDGQHRLFSYASEQVRQKVKDDAQIVVTAVVFDSVDHAYIERFSASTFIEINTNQTRVSSLHLFGIGYEILGDTHQKYLPAHVLRKVNARQNKLRGLLRTSDSPRGKIRSMEIIGSLGVITNVNKIANLAAASGTLTTERRAGYQNLMNATVAELVNPETLTEKGIACIERYFNVVAKVFVHDWPDPGPAETTSSFGLTKFFAAMIRLLRQFIDEGATWQMVEAELQAIKKNVMALRKKAKYEVVLFLATDLKIPDATARISDVFRFLHANRTRPTSMTKVLKTV